MAIGNPPVAKGLQGREMTLIIRIEALPMGPYPMPLPVGAATFTYTRFGELIVEVRESPPPAPK